MSKPLFTFDGLPITGIIDGMLVLECYTIGSRRGVWYQPTFYRVDEDLYDQVARERAFIGLETL